jgi:16S rRNA (adenine1518-N6/adenine1519-N6)-dimethyltransferase
MVVGNSPKKALGQHWLYDTEVLESMCDAVNTATGDNILEIGPGLGTLTARLLGLGANVTALEFDADLARTLRQSTKRMAAQNNSAYDDSLLSVLEGDIRSFDFTSMPVGYKICANIPYYLTSNLIRLLCETPNQPWMVALLMQKEVAERIAASDGKMSMLSCVAQFYFECYEGDVVPARLFTPPPKVDSQILIMHRRQHQLYDLDSKKFFRLIKAGFGEKRKTLRNSLSAGLAMSKNESVELLIRSGVDPMRRAETMSLNEWKTVFDNFERA